MPFLTRLSLSLPFLFSAVSLGFEVFELSVGKGTISLANLRLPLAGGFNEENSSQCHPHTLHVSVVHYETNIEFGRCKQLPPSIVVISSLSILLTTNIVNLCY